MQPDLLLETAQLAVGLSRVGGALTGASARGRPFLCGAPGEGVLMSACFPMVPVCNRVSGNGFNFAGRRHALTPNGPDPLYLHGDGWRAEWQILEAGPDRARLGFHHDRGPFRYRAEQVVRLAANHLSLRLTVENAGPEPMPFGLGLHPRFPREGATLCFAAAARWSEGPDHVSLQREAIPPEADFIVPRALPASWQNNAYDGWPGRATMRWPGMVVELDADPLLSALMLYAPGPEEDFFCLEPMSHLPDALNRPGQPGLAVLVPGEALSGEIRMTITTEPGA